MKRRNFIKTAGVATAGMPIFLNGLQLSAIPASPLFNFVEETDKVLVLIQLNGGNDGLNTVIPRDQYRGLTAVRKNVLIPERQVLALTDKTGFHPSLKGLQLLYQEGKIGVVQDVGYPNQNRSHFQSYDIWATGLLAEKYRETGWMGRHFEDLYPDFPEGYPNANHPHPFAVTMGYIVSETCQGKVANYSITLNDPFNIYELFEGEGSETPNNYYGDELRFIRNAIAQANAYSEVVSAVARRGRNLATYRTERNHLARQLKNVALLISGGLQTRIYVVSIGGFDTHANQVVEGNPTVGLHADLLEKISSAISSFQEDLKKQGLEERVIGMTFSEFGRKIKSNESLGTDHGTAAPMIMFGSCVKADVLGANPEIPTDVDPAEGVPMQYDFRDVYGSILMDWFKVPEDKVRTLLHENFRKLPIIQDCRVTTSADEPTQLDLEARCFPNPFDNWTNLEFNLKESAWVRLSIFDAVGKELRVLTNQTLPAGSHRIPWEANGLAAGAYFFRIQVGNQIKNQRLIKK